jgi:hypothetical protein
MAVKKVLIGRVGVDSGQLIIVDPCYLEKWVADEPYGHLIQKDTVTGKHHHFAGWTTTNEDKLHDIKDLKSKPFENYNAIIRDGKTANELKAAGELVEVKPSRLTNQFGYDAACRKSHDMKEDNPDGTVHLGVVTPSGWGDGCYPVYAEFDKNGRIKNITIKFNVG